RKKVKRSFKERWSNSRARNAVVNVATVVGLAMLLYSGLVSLFGGRGVQTVLAQQDLFMARRVDQIEQRLNTLESRVSRIESDSRVSAITPRLPNNNDSELRLVQSQIDGFRLRLGEVECGLLRL